jgi:hypothetical protein
MINCGWLELKLNKLILLAEKNENTLVELSLVINDYI